MALVRVYCGLAATGPARPQPAGAPSDRAWLTAAVVDDAGRLLDICDIGDDAVGYAELGALLAERSGGAGSVAVAADSDEHQVTLLLAAAGRPLAIVDEDLVTDYSDRFADDESAEEIAAGPAERAAVGLARALQAGALTAAGQAAPRELMALNPVLAAHAAVAAGRHGTAIALREVLRELYPAALRAYPDPAEPIPLAILDALPEPGLLGAATTNRSRDAAVAAQLAGEGIADAHTITEAITALRVAIAETPRRAGIGKGTTQAIAETIRETVAAVRACDAAVSALVALLAEKSAPLAPAVGAPVTPLPVTGAERLGARRPGGARPATMADPAPPAPLAGRTPVGRPGTRSPARPAGTGFPVAVPAVPTAPEGYDAYAAAGSAQQPVPMQSAPQSVPMQPVAQPPVPPVAASAHVPAAVPAMPTRPQAVPHQPPAQAAPPVQPPALRPAAAQPAGPQPATMPVPPMQPAAAQAVAPPVAVRPMPAPAASPTGAPATMPPAQPAAQPPVSGGPTGPMVPSMPKQPTGSYPTVPTAGPAPHEVADRENHPRTGRGAGGSIDTPLQPTWTPEYQPVAYDAPAFPLRGGAAPGSRENWPVNAPADDDAYARGATQETETVIPRQRDGRVAPPWQSDLGMPEPPSLRLVEPAPEPPVRTPALRLVTGEGGRGRGSSGPSADSRSGRSYSPPDRPSAAMVDGGDDDLLIFAQTRSAWFVDTVEEAEQPPVWSDAADFGWSAALRAENPEVGAQTDTGLPRRVPQANLVPGSPLPPPAPETTPGLRIVRDPAAMAAHTTGYFRGSRRGEEVRGYAVGGRPGRESGGGWDFSRDGWDSEQDSGYRSAARR